MTTRLKPILEAELAQKGQLGLFHDMEMPLLPILAEMEMTGIALDVQHLAGMAADLQKKLTRLEKKIYEQAGGEFNINSTQQLSEVLFGRLNLKPADRSRKTSAGKFSTAADVLEDMRGQHAVIELILEQRELSKLKSTYVDALPQAVNPDTGRVHTTYKQTGSVTGRIASEAPNLQNIPIRTELGREVRKAFVSTRGRRLVAADYSQIELRIAAHVSQDSTLLEAFRRGEDIHAATAAVVLGVAADKISKEQRRQAKTVNFGILYGQGAFGLTRTTGFTLAEAENFIKAYFERLPGLKQYLDRTKKSAAERGYVESLLGRRRYFPGLTQPANTREGAIARARAEREAINAPIQSTAADVIKLAMLRLPQAFAEAGLEAQLLLQVHDELVVECKTADVKAVATILCNVMENAFTLDIPLGVEVRSGQNWEEMKAIKVR
jgi:DNA polymerase-1